ncbi:hypothetical protein [Photobacterium damselae]|uniref:hypothetical protein n=1 Tax=Photobacterium damselae TaxID=38293 RepID=UPI001F2AA818|nr:hypothetical protein [Photobacterium damselae]UKA04831.1 hypothetical protein IHC89_21550 [Photobacterium damselae subsp. damselae]
MTSLNKSRMIASLENDIETLQAEIATSVKRGWYESAMKKDLEVKTIKRVLFSIRQGDFDN